MKIKTSELTGTALEWAVAKADNNLYPTGDVRLLDRNLFTITAGDYENPDVWQRYAPSTDWAEGGPLIQRERMEVMPCMDVLVEKWIATHCLRQSKWTQECGPTPLIAVMRAFCCSKLGDEVDIPDELLP